jgi:poly(beta-D-mannuronate) lyase
MKIKILTGLIALLLLTINAQCSNINDIYSKHITVSNVAELKQALINVTEGTCIELADGEYKDVQTTIACKAKSNAPILIKAQNKGKARITGNSQFLVTGDGITLQDLYFTDGARQNDGDLIKDQGLYNRYINCKFDSYNKVTGTWIKLEGAYSLVERCEFKGKTSPASYINMDVPAEGGCHHVIRRNYFSRPPLGQNGGSAMRVGHGSMALHHAYILIEENLFENCDGEEEIISVKSSRNYLRHNTFRMCRGALSLRQGRGTVVESNFFIGNGKKRCGGLTIRGRDHFIFNNYFADMKAKKTGVINFGVASTEDPERIKAGLYPRHFPLTQDIIICHNTIVNNNSQYHINFLEGYGTRNRYVLSSNISFYNNLFEGNSQLMDAKPDMAVMFNGNYISNKNHTKDGVVWTSMKYRVINKLQVPVVKVETNEDGKKLPEQADYSVFRSRDLSISKDVFGLERNAIKHVGCVNYTNSNDALHLPLNKQDVGCSF